MRIATFNCENLFARYRFRSNFDALQSDGFTINDLAFSIYNETEKQITARAIREVNADVIALQEVESLPLLDRFNSSYLGGMKYKYRILIDSHDPRGIDVALLSRYPFISVTSHREERNSNNTGTLFSRDCLEVRIAIPNGELTAYVNHFKSMMGGRDQTKAKRVSQADRVTEIISSTWEASQYEGYYIVLGDLNDYPDSETSLTSLLNHEGLVNAVEDLPEEERWTHYYKGGNDYKQLDYLFLSPQLADSMQSGPQIMRKGMPYRAERYTGERFPNVGDDRPKASDHAPLYVDVEIGGT